MEVRLLNTQKTYRGAAVAVLQSELSPAYTEKTTKELLERKQIQLFIKRAFDIVLSSLLILFFSPVLILVAAIIKLTSKGPVLYSNERVGYRDINFRCFKFRSMVTDQSSKASDYAIALAGQEKGVLHKVKDDARITWIGRIIRKTSIDELPQLFNVLKGEMSIIGPRPLVPFMLKHLPEFKETRCLVRPGITGLWQIRDRVNNTNAEFMIRHDTEYIRNYSLLLDLKILAKTPMKVLTGEGAY